MNRRLNEQPTKELRYFQKLLLANKYIKQLNLWLDELEWKNEKKETIIEMKESEIAKLQNQIKSLSNDVAKVNTEFRAYVKSHKEFKKDKEREDAQQNIIEQLRSELKSTKERLILRDKMVKVLEKQQLIKHK